MTEYAGYRATIEVQLGATWTPIAQVRDIAGPGLASEQIEVSHRDSRYRRYVAGMLDGGEVTFQIVFDPNHASHDPTLADSMFAYAVSGEKADFRIKFPGVDGVVTDGFTTAAFEAFVSNFEIASALEDGLLADLTLKISGDITWTHTAPVNA